jgi:hypothetical protein
VCGTNREGRPTTLIDLPTGEVLELIGAKKGGVPGRGRLPRSLKPDFDNSDQQSSSSYENTGRAFHPSIFVNFEFDEVGRPPAPVPHR